MSDANTPSASAGTQLPQGSGIQQPAGGQPAGQQVQGQPQSQQTANQPAQPAQGQPAAGQPNVAGLDVLAQREAAVRSQEAALKAREAKLTGVPVDKLSAAMSSKDPAAVLTALGFDAKEVIAKLAGSLVAKPAPTPEEALAAELAAAKEVGQKALTAAERIETNQTIREQLSYIGSLVTAAPEKYELVRAKKAEGLVLETILANSKRGEELTHEKALDIVEAVLREEADAFLATDYVKKKQGGSQQTSGTPTTPTKPTSGITNQSSSGPANTGAALPQDPDQKWRELKRRAGV